MYLRRKLDQRWSLNRQQVKTVEIGDRYLIDKTYLQQMGDNLPTPKGGYKWLNKILTAGRRNCN